MLVSIPDKELTDSVLYKLLTFYKDINGMSQDNIKIITNSENIAKLIPGNKDTENIEIVGNMLEGMQILNLQLIKSRESSIKPEYLKPGMMLFSNLYDAKGNKLSKDGAPTEAFGIVKDGKVTMSGEDPVLRSHTFNASGEFIQYDAEKSIAVKRQGSEDDNMQDFTASEVKFPKLKDTVAYVKNADQNNQVTLYSAQEGETMEVKEPGKDGRKKVYE